MINLKSKSINNYNHELMSINHWVLQFIEAHTHYYRKLHPSCLHSHQFHHKSDYLPHSVYCSKVCSPFCSSCYLAVWWEIAKGIFYTVKTRPSLTVHYLLFPFFYFIFFTFICCPRCRLWNLMLTLLSALEAEVYSVRDVEAHRHRRDKITHHSIAFSHPTCLCSERFHRR